MGGCPNGGERISNAVPSLCDIRYVTSLPPVSPHNSSTGTRRCVSTPPICCRAPRGASSPYPPARSHSFPSGADASSGAGSLPGAQSRAEPLQLYRQLYAEAARASASDDKAKAAQEAIEQEAREQEEENEDGDEEEDGEEKVLEEGPAGKSGARKKGPAGHGQRGGEKDKTFDGASVTKVTMHCGADGRLSQSLPRT